MASIEVLAVVSADRQLGSRLANCDTLYSPGQCTWFVDGLVFAELVPERVGLAIISRKEHRRASGLLRPATTASGAGPGLS